MKEGLSDNLILASDRQLAVQPIWDDFLFDDEAPAEQADFARLPQLMGLSGIPSLVISLALDDFEHFSPADRQKHLKSLEKIAAAALSGQEHFIHAGHRNHLYINLLLPEPPSLRRQAAELAGRIIDVSGQQPGMSVTAGLAALGHPADMVEWRHQSRQSFGALRRKFFEGRGRFYFYENIDAYLSEEQAPLLERKLAVAVGGGQVEDARLHMQAMLQFIIGRHIGQLLYIRVRLQQLASLLCRLAMEGGMPEISAFDMLSRTTHELFRTFDVSALADIMKDMAATAAAGIGIPPRGRLAEALQNLPSDELAEITLKRLAAIMNESYTYLSKRFRRELDTGFVEYANRLRLERARKLMADHDLNLTETARAAGFSSYHQFARICRLATGLPPGEYRRTLRP